MLVRFGGKVCWLDLVAKYAGQVGGKVCWLGLVAKYAGQVWWQSMLVRLVAKYAGQVDGNHDLQKFGFCWDKVCFL